MSESENTKYTYRLPPCPAYDVEGTENWLSEMAAQGLLLSADGFFLGFAAFAKGEPRRVQYRLEAAPSGGFFDDTSTPDTEAVEYAERYGWEYVARRGEFYIYRSDAETERELNTDPRVQAIAMKGIRARQRWAMFDLVFWLVLYPLLYRGGKLFAAPLLLSITLGTWLTLFSLIMAVWLCTRAVVRAVSLERRYRRLARGETPNPARHAALSPRCALRHRVMAVVRVLLVTVWIVLVGARLLGWMSETDEVSLEDYLAAGNDIPFATVADIARTQGTVVQYRQTMKGVGNTITAFADPLAPVNIDFCEIAEVTLADGRMAEGGLYVDYHETAAPWIAAEIAREYHRTDRRDEDYRVLDIDLPDVDYAVAYLDALHFQTVILQKGDCVLHASFHPYSESVEIPIEVWVAVLAECLQ